MPSEELKNSSIQNTPKTDPVKTAEQQLADIKSQAAKIVGNAQKLDPNIKISVADAEMIGAPKLAIPTQKRETPPAPELTRTGTTTIPQTGVDKAREALLAQVPEEDRDTISAILDASMGLQTERGTELETQLDTLSQSRLDIAQNKKDRKLEGNRLMDEQGIPELSAELESIRSEADVLDARKNAAVQAEASRKGVSNIAQSNNIQAIEKDYNLQKANLAIRELASVGKINAATKLIDTKLDIKYGDLEAEAELVKEQINAILPLLSREDAKVAETRLLLNEEVSATIADAREKDKALEEFKLQSYINAQQNGASPAVLSAIMSSDNREDVAGVGGTFIQDPVQKLQMRATEANIAQSWASVAESKARQALAESELAKQKKIEEAVANGEVILTPEQQENAYKLGKDFESESKDFKAQVGAYNRIVASAEDPSAAGDLALIFNYMKMLDPGSTVREGEFATAQNSAGVPDIIRAQYNKVFNGQRLADTQRNDFVDRSTRIYNASLEQQMELEDRYKDRAVNLFGLPANAANLIIQDIRSTGAVSEVAWGMQMNNLSDGQIIELKNLGLMPSSTPVTQ